MTADPAALLALAAECEAAGGPDRELDARVWVALHGGEIVALQPGYVQSGDWSAIGFTQTYTASVDAALFLLREVLPGWGSSLWTVESNDYPRRPHEVSIWPPAPIAMQYFSASAPTLPLALVVAVLRAVAARGDAP